MVEMHAKYVGEKHCEIVHLPSSSVIETDAPKDNQGRGERFSPTDMVGAALATCVLTTMAIMAERDGINMNGATAQVSKVMNPNPRRIARLPVVVKMPSNIPKEARAKLEAAAHACPVHRSLHPDVEAPIEINYPD
jgi:putative redox protein